MLEKDRIPAKAFTNEMAVQLHCEYFQNENKVLIVKHTVPQKSV